MKSDKYVFLILRLFMPISCCLVLANIYYAQPIIIDMAQSIGLNSSQSGLIVTASQIGYCLGVILLVPMGDIFRSKTLITILVLLTSFTMLIASVSESMYTFLIAIFFVGIFSSVVQIIIPLGVGIAKPDEKGIVTGLLVAGVLLGIAMARITASFVVEWFSWRSIYWVASIIMLLLSILIAYLLPSNEIRGQSAGYFKNLSTMWRLFLQLPKLRYRLYHQAAIFSCFTMFWATAPIVLKEKLGLTHFEIATISLVSLTAPFVAIYAGKLIDRGKEQMLTKCGLITLAIAFLVIPIFGIQTIFFAIAIFLLDPGIVTTNVVSQQAVLNMMPEARSRLNALFVAGAFFGGSIGAYIGPWIYSHYGWLTMSAIGLMLLFIAYISFLFGKRVT